MYFICFFQIWLFWVSMFNVTGVNYFVLEMSGHLGGFPHHVGSQPTFFLALDIQNPPVIPGKEVLGTPRKPSPEMFGGSFIILTFGVTGCLGEGLKERYLKHLASDPVILKPSSLKHGKWRPGKCKRIQLSRYLKTLHPC